MTSADSTPHPIRLALVEDDTGLRETLRQVFGSAPDFRVVGAYANGEHALRELPGCSPEVILMDINLPGMMTTTIRSFNRWWPGRMVICSNARRGIG